MKTTRILQIGDVHLPEWTASETDIDTKDAEFSQEIIGDLKHSRLSQILKGINKTANSGTIDAVFLMGDLTSYGRNEFIAPAMDIFNTLLQDASSATRPEIYVVPGNHDVNRNDAQRLGTLGKFAHFREAAEGLGWSSPPVEGARCLKLGKGKTDSEPLPLILINSSIGSQSLHALAPSIENSVTESERGDGAPVKILSDSLINDGSETPDFGGATTTGHTLTEQRYRHLDTPYISKEAMANTIQAASSAKGSTILMCAHHNLLPQRVPRISPYAELLNGGHFRSALLDTNKNFIYLHGHIHDDPIEIIERPSAKIGDTRKCTIITISAPPIWKGYNEIALFHDQSGDVFLVRVTLYRLNPSGFISNFTDQDTRFIPLVGRSEMLVSNSANKLWEYVKQQTRSFPEIENSSSAPNGDELENTLMALFCGGFVDIKNLGLPRHRWRITALGGSH
ncbi:metallophosphoesterase family protein [Citreimonas salinaria]|uniref:Calcineurin-like phosphoesterase n=1 Tax=Citreimonas salinaria TaxID=321339 RepID=A0A1H3LM69_9RHOB|nr:metallophosphoesterase family protein [Citreimonas salinaria]SDY65637.1 Calcineurin-like phosphoesterase [Citreimonas salinaria]